MDGTLTETTERTHNYPMATCPHCAREVPARMAEMHSSVCAQRPEMKARTLAALESAVPGEGVKMSVYDRHAKQRGVPPVSTLLRNYGGTWAAVLDSFGLTVPDDARKRRPARTPAQQRMTAKQREDAAIADVAAMDVEVRAVLAGEFDRGLTVMDRPRQLSDGRLAWMIR